MVGAFAYNALFRHPDTNDAIGAMVMMAAMDPYDSYDDDGSPMHACATVVDVRTLF